MGDNDAGYSHGNLVQATTWLAASITEGVAISGRLHAQSLGRVDGIDPAIAGPAQTANPDFNGGESLTYFTGLNLAATGGAIKGWRLGIEAGVPLVQDLNGPQMPTDYTLTVGVRKSF